MEENIVEEARKFVEQECEKFRSNYRIIYINRLIPFHNFMKAFAEKYNLIKDETEIVEAFAWFYNIRAIIIGMENNHITKCEIFEKRVNNFGLDKSKIEIVKHCIFVHFWSKFFNPKSSESQIVADADIISHFENMGGLFKTVLLFKNLNRFESESITKKFINCLREFLDNAKSILKNKYNVAESLDYVEMGR